MKGHQLRAESADDQPVYLSARQWTPCLRFYNGKRQ